MSVHNLFQLGIDLETGATHMEEKKALHAKKVDAPQAGACSNNNDTKIQSLFDPDREDHFIRKNGRVYAGTHLIIELIDADGLDDEERIQNAFRSCVDKCGATLLHIHTHKFTPQGVSGVAVLAESHISVHTWPEARYAAFDVFMCGDALPWEAVNVLRHAFSAGDVRVKEILRGEGIV